MPKLTVEGKGEFEVPEGKRLVLALEDEAGVDQLHACGGNAPTVGLSPFGAPKYASNTSSSPASGKRPDRTPRGHN
jgi:hypothetical protein